MPEMPIMRHSDPLRGPDQPIPIPEHAHASSEGLLPLKTPSDELSARKGRVEEVTISREAISETISLSIGSDREPQLRDSVANIDSNGVPLDVPPTADLSTETNAQLACEG